jgi:hypothetical protein
MAQQQAGQIDSSEYGRSKVVGEATSSAKQPQRLVPPALRARGRARQGRQCTPVRRGLQVTAAPSPPRPDETLVREIAGLFRRRALLRSNPPLGALIGLLIGHAFDTDWFKLRRDDPYSVLGLTDEASDAEIEQAYRRLIAQYHPDRMNGAAAELRRQAEARAREINAAYDRIQTLRRRWTLGAIRATFEQSRPRPSRRGAPCNPPYAPSIPSQLRRSWMAGSGSTATDGCSQETC